MKDKIFRKLNAASNALRLPFAMELNNPVFITGVGRSGTTLFCDILRAHQQLAVYPNEANELWHPATYPWHRKKNQHVKPYWLDPAGFSEFSVQQFLPENISAMKRSFSFFQKLSGNRQFVLKSAMITFMLPFIKNLYPQARFIVLVRDGRSVAYSYSVKQFEKIVKHPEGYADYSNITRQELMTLTAQVWQHQFDYLDTAILNKQLPAGSIFFLKYEDLCSDPQAAMRSVFDFMGVEPKGFDHAVLNRISSTNYKVNKDENPAILNAAESAMSSGLARFNYFSIHA